MHLITKKKSVNYEALDVVEKKSLYYQALQQVDTLCLHVKKKIKNIILTKCCFQISLIFLIDLDHPSQRSTDVADFTNLTKYKIRLIF